MFYNQSVCPECDAGLIVETTIAYPYMGYIKEHSRWECTNGCNVDQGVHTNDMFGDKLVPKYEPPCYACPGCDIGRLEVYQTKKYCEVCSDILGDVSVYVLGSPDTKALTDDLF